jgi:uncharacterized protein
MITWAWLFLASWLAASISGVAGFGGALLLLPVLTGVLGAKSAVPVLTVAQLLGNASRAGFGYRQIRWRPVAYFCLGAIPLSALGSRVFVALPKGPLSIGLGLFLLAIIAWRRLGLGQRGIRAGWLVLGGAAVGLLSALLGSAGPLGAACFLGLNLPSAAYVASEAVTAVGIHVTKTVVYQRYALVGWRELALGLFLGAAMVLGSWTGKKLINRLPQKTFALLVEILLFLSALQLLLTR